MSFSKNRLRGWGIAFSVVVIVVLSIFAWIGHRFRSSLPSIDGRQTLAGLSAPALIERDAAGVPTLRGANRADVARALGFAHGQDRFFKMDLARRRAAGELAELFGAAALPVDQSARVHEFRALAGQVVARLTPERRALLEAYAAGVNAARERFAPRPWEYQVLRVDPRPWTPEDSVLCIYAMALELDDGLGTYERTLMTLREQLGSRALAFFAPVQGPGDAALDGTTAPLPPVPNEQSLNVRGRPALSAQPGSGPLAGTVLAGRTLVEPPDLEEGGVTLGSNSLGVSGRWTGGPALIENDMHLGHTLPNVWYRARLRWRDAAGQEHDLIGITLPGTPALVAGSNGAIAWAFTNSYIDTSDLVVVQPDAVRPDNLYIQGDHVADFTIRRQTIQVKDAPAVVLETRWTAWGPVVGEQFRSKRPLALKWSLHDPSAIDFHLMELETATTVEAALEIVHRSGIPPQNVIVGDRAGALAWTIAGRVPDRLGHDGRLPIVWAYGDRGWKGFLPPEQVPVVRADTESSVPGALWSGNQRMIGGHGLAHLGHGGYQQPARARQLRDDLAALQSRSPTQPVRPPDLLGVVLDDRALWMERWRKHLLDTLSPAALQGHSRRAEFRQHVEQWDGRATASSVGYRLVRAWRLKVASRVLEPIFAPCRAAWAGFSPYALPYDEPLWTLVEQRPLQLLEAQYASWSDLEWAAVDDVLADLKTKGLSLSEATWGRQNTLRMQHPFSRVLPGWLGRVLLDMPAVPLPGDNHLPRVQSPTEGASERLVVSPGREAHGLFHMPGGQSGHPLSPFYREGHDAWVRGQPTPLLPGPTRHSLQLLPRE